MRKPHKKNVISESKVSKGKINSGMLVKFNYYSKNPKLVEQVLIEGAKKASIVANKTLSRVRSVLGYSS